ncbi:MAG: hypothetical protein A2X86_09855 [Bdellovibrionales bacterium GWA2_49_15]|nr:MAG: hypothetical protein A2X86_09855 [Bdellovibrionales bacterium GWA2_49_15]HAZ13087.1 hypothetical protein [Bdellovibrionales bacterium]
MIKNRLTLLVILAAIVSLSCARVNTLNLQRHAFGEAPTKIIWLQIAGLSDEHLPLLKFSSQSKQISFERSYCSGKMWAYNLYFLRPKAHSNFLSQVNGSKNQKNDCSDFDNPPFWKNLGKSGALAGVLENGIGEGQGLDSAFQCKSEQNFYSDLTIVWKMARTKSPDAAFFQTPVNIPLTAGVYFDKSCQLESCHSGLFENAKQTFESFIKRPFANVYMVRDFEYGELLKKGEIFKAREHFLEIDKLHHYFLDYQKANPNILVLVSSTAALAFEFPEQGNQWEEFDKKGKNILFRQQSLMSSVFATGAMSENFCGLFEESEMRDRILKVPAPLNFSDMFGL